MNNSCDGCFGAADLQCAECPKNKKEKVQLSNTVLDIYKELSKKYWDLFTSLPKFIQRYIIWKRWVGGSANSKIHKICVLFGIVHSPTFNNVKSWYYATQGGTNLWILSVDLAKGPDFVNKEFNIKRSKE